MRELDEVVQEADQAARQRHEDDDQPRQLVFREQKERERGSEQDQNAAGGRRSALLDVVRRTFLADLLPELLAAEKRDKTRPGEDRDQAGDDAGDEDSRHATTPASASATRSRPSTRAPLTRTQSPGASSSRTS